MSNHMKTRNTNPKIAMQTLRNEHDYHEMLVANQITTTHHVRRIFMPIDQTNTKIIYLTQQFVKSNYFNPIHLATRRE